MRLKTTDKRQEICKYITCPVSMFNLTKLSIYYLHIKAVRYLVVNTFLCNRIKFDVFFCNHIVNMFQERYCFLLFSNETTLMLLLKKQEKPFFIHFCKPKMYHHNHYDQ